MPDLSQLVAQASPDDTSGLVEAVSRHRGDRGFVTLVAHDQNTYLHPSYIEPFYEVLEKLRHQERLDLFLNTTGGKAEVPWSIVSLLREYSDHRGVLVPHRAMSGGTHIALAGEDLVLGPLSCLGSVDPKRSHHLLPEDKPHSVQDLKHCMEFINRQWKDDAGGLAGFLSKRSRSKQIGEVVRELFDKVHPLAIGALEQSYELSRLITRKVLRTRNDFSEDDRRIEEIEERLAGEYFSHGFAIHRNDVEEELELPVDHPSDELWSAMRELYQVYRDQLNKVHQLQVQTPQDQTEYKLRYLAFIETEDTRRVLAHAQHGDQQLEEWVEA